MPPQGRRTSYAEQLRKMFPGLFQFLGDAPSDLLRRMANEAEIKGWDFDRLINQVQTSTAFKRWDTAGRPTPTPDTGGGGGGGGGGGTTPPVGSGGTPDRPPRPGTGGGGGGGGTQPPTPAPGNDPNPPSFQADPNKDIRGALIQFLNDYNLPQSLMTFVENALQKDMSFNEIIVRLRQTREYKQAFPENFVREANGFNWLPEAQVLQLRSDFRQVAKDAMGLNNLSSQELTDLIGGNVSLVEWERRLQTYKTFEKYGAAVQTALSQELGFDVSNDRVFAFMNPDISTPELDLAYERAMIRGQPAVLGFGIRPEEEADTLIKFGIDPNQAFANYQGIASELPRIDRMRAIENYINANPANFPENPVEGAGYGTLFRAIQLRDPDAIRELEGLMSRETARFQAGGGPVRSGTATIGLLSQAERANLS